MLVSGSGGLCNPCTFESIRRLANQRTPSGRRDGRVHLHTDLDEGIVPNDSAPVMTEEQDSPGKSKLTSANKEHQDTCDLQESPSSSSRIALVVSSIGVGVAKYRLLLLIVISEHHLIGALAFQASDDAAEVRVGVSVCCQQCWWSPASEQGSA